MKIKSLVIIGGQENYMDIELFMGLEIIANDGRILERFDTFGKPPSFKEIKIEPEILSRNNSMYTQSSLSRKMTILSINYNFIINEIMKRMDDGKMDELQIKFYKFRTKYGFKSKYTIRLKRKIIYQKLNNDRKAEMILNYTFGNLYEALPDRYKRIDEGRMDLGFGHSLLKSIIINTKGLAYLEQQHDLKRIKLDDNSLLLLNALKEFMRFRNEDETFDDYLDSWIKRLIGVKNENNSNI